MFRVTARAEVLYGHYNDYLVCCDQLNKMFAERGMKQWQLFGPIDGKNNIIVTSVDYESYDEMKREQDRFYSDAECMKVFRDGARLLVQGTAATEFLDEAPHLA